MQTIFLAHYIDSVAINSIFMVQFQHGVYSDVAAWFAGTGNSASTSSTVHILPSSTALGAATNTYFSYFGVPPTTGNGTNAYTIYVAGAPSASGTLNNAYAFYVAAGLSYFGGSTTLAGTATFSGAILASGSGAIDFSGSSGTFTSTTGQFSVSNSSVNFESTNNTIGSVFNVSGLGQTYTDDVAGSTNINVFCSIGANTLASSFANTTNKAINFYLRNAVIQGTNQTIENTYNLYVDNVTNTNANVTEAASVYIVGAPVVASGSTYSLLVASGISRFAGSITAAGGITASGSGAIDFSGNSGLFKTTTGAVTIGSGAVGITGTATFSGATNAILASGSGNIDFSGNSGTFSSPTGQFGISNSSTNFSASNNTVGNIFNISDFGRTYTDTSVTAPVANMVFNSIGGSTLASTIVKTTTNAYNLYMRSAVIQGTNQTITNTYNLFIDNVTNTNANVTEAASLAINGAPTVSSGNTYSLLVKSGISRFNGSITAAGGITASGSTAIDFSGNSGIFNTTTGAVTIGSGAVGITGTATFSGATNAILASGSGNIDFSGNSGLFKTTTGAVTIGSGAVGITGTTTFSGATNAILASGSGNINFSGNSGLFRTTTGPVIIGSGSVGITGTATFSAATNAILASGSGAINFSGNSGTFTSPTGKFTVSNSSVNFVGANNTIGSVFNVSAFGQTYTDTSVGNIGLSVLCSIGSNTLASSSSKTTDKAFNFYLSSAVLQGTNQTIGTTYNLYIDNGNNTGVTVSNGQVAASLYIEGAPKVVSGSTYSIFVANDISKFAGSITVSGGITASGSTAIDFSGNSGLFKTTTGAVTIGGNTSAITIGSGTTPSTSITVASGTTGNIDFSNSSGLFKTTTGAVTIGSGAVGITGITTHSAQLISTQIGNSTISSAPIYINPGPTAITASSSNYFTYFNAPATTLASGVATNAYTIYVAGAPTISGGGTLTNAYALYVNSGVSLFGDSTTSSSSTTGAVIINGGVGIGGAINIAGVLNSQAAVKSKNATTATTTYSISATTDHFIEFTGGATTATLPTISGNSGVRFIIMNNSTSGTTTIAVQSGQNLNSVLNGTIALANRYDRTQIIGGSDGWYEI